MKRIVCVADSHCDYRWTFNLPEGDIFIHAGDIDIQCKEHLEYFNDVLKDLPFKYKIVIGGNHDIYLEEIGIFQIEQKLTNAIYLENCGIDIEGLRFWGSPISPEFNNWAFNRRRGDEIKKYWDLIPDNIDVLVSHGPPYGILDQTLMANGEFGPREGCLDLYKRVEELRQNKLKLHIFGHFHSQYGIIEKNKTKFVNASVVNENYELVNDPIVIDL